MRFFRVLPALGLLFGARASQLDSRVPHTLDTRELLDVCADISLDLIVPNLLGILTALGLVDVCLCISALPLNIQAEVDANLLASLGGVADINAVLAALINQSAARNNCNYPDHSRPICSSRRCAFECIDGFTPFPPNNPTQCICEAPSQICNGQCVASGACPSQQARSNRRRWLGSGSCAERGHGWLACGVYGNNPSAWECVNTASDLESCGGCAVSLTAYSPKGMDCTAIPNVANVACEWGQCVVRHCLHGLVPSVDGNSCVSESEYEDAYHRHHHHHHHHNYKQHHGGMEDDSAKAFGLEHMPLQRD